MSSDADQQLVWELRVHGVGNTPPESVLKRADDPDVEFHDPPRMQRVAGDPITGFYQRQDDSADDGLLVEAYSWGRLTAGSKRESRIANLRRAGWTLLLPFALSNAALWARPRVPYDPRERGMVAVTGWLLRALAVGLTCTMTLAVSGVAMDVIAWQCRPRLQQCGGPRLIQSLLAEPFFTTGARRTLAGTVHPSRRRCRVFWLSGSRSTTRLPFRATAAGPGGRRDRTRLEHPDFWRGDEQIVR